MSEPKPTFDPRDRLMKVKGADYLPVSARIAWFRDDSPNGTIDVEHVVLDPEWAVFRATITRIGDGGELLGRGSGYGAVTRKDFPAGHVEKASTKAIGRALASLGYGTEDVGDDDGEGTGGVVDTPIDLTAKRTRRDVPQPPQRAAVPSDSSGKATVRPAPPRRATAASDRDQPLTNGVTDKQRGMILKLCDNLGMTEDERHAMQQEMTGHASLTTMSKQDASKIIDYLLKLQPAAPEPGSPEDIATIEHITSTPSAVAAPEEERRRDIEGQFDSWNVFWPWARKQGFKTLEQINDFVGHDVREMLPDQVRAEMESRLAAVGK